MNRIVRLSIFFTGILILSSLFIVITFNPVRKDNIREVEFNGNQLESSFPPYVDRAPILIVGNPDFHLQAQNPLNNWDLGGTRDGTEDNPYIIDSYRIVGSSSENLIEIRNTDLYFEINYCLLIGGAYGIYFEGITHGILYSNNITYNTEAGIYIYLSNRTEISSNTICNNVNNGIFYESSRINTIRYNEVYNNSYGIQIDDSDHNSILINNVFNNTRGISMFFSDNNFVDNNTVYDCDWGIQNMGDNNDSIITNNYIYNWVYKGIILGKSTNNTISGNIVFNGTGVGIQVMNSNKNNVLTNNWIFDNSEDGLLLVLSDKNKILHNRIENNGDNGINLDNSRNNIISCNNISFNGYYGIYVGFLSFDNTICWNNFVSNCEDFLPGTPQGFDSDADLNNKFHHNYYDDWDGIGGYLITGWADNQDLTPLVSPVDLYDCDPCTDPGTPVCRIGLPLTSLLLICSVISIFMIIYFSRKRINIIA